MTGTVDVRRAAGRFHTRTAWLSARHSFSFGAHYRADNLGLGALVACNEDVVAPGAGYADHPHRNVEIVTWVLFGRLRHEDDGGRRVELGPGQVQLLSAGDGVRHAEHNASLHDPLELVQMWVRPDRPGPPAYAVQDVPPAPDRLVPVVSGRGHAGALPLRQTGAVLWVGRLSGGAPVPLPTAPLLHLLVTAGSLHLPGAAGLVRGDAVRLAGAGAPLLTGTGQALVWQLDLPGHADQPPG